MSVYVTAYVWEHSAHKGTDLLLMLAIADIADKSGKAYPSVATLARYVRMSDRNTTRVLARLEASGELAIQRNAGPKGTHLFQVRMTENLPLFEFDQSGDKLSGDRLSGRHSYVRGGVTNRVESGDTAMSPEPVPIIEPSISTSALFDQFWNAYPRKTAKVKALEVWKRLKPTPELLSKMLTAIEAQKKTRQWRDDGVIPHARTWLNQRRWEDDVVFHVKPAEDTTCRRILPGTSERCGMPGKPHPVYGFSCEHCDRKDEEAMTRSEMPPAIRERLGLGLGKRVTT